MSNEQLFAFVRKNIICVIAVGISLLLGLIIYFRSDVGPAAEALQLEKSAEAERLAANIENAVQLKDQYATLVAANAAIERRMIHVSQLADNLQYFYKLESETGTKLSDPHQTSTAVAKAPPGKVFIPVSFTVGVQGDYLAALDFLRRLESGARYCRVLSCTINPGATSDGRRGTTVNMTLGFELLGVP